MTTRIMDPLTTDDGLGTSVPRNPVERRKWWIFFTHVGRMFLLTSSSEQNRWFTTLRGQDGTTTSVPCNIVYEPRRGYKTLKRRSPDGIFDITTQVVGPIRREERHETDVPCNTE